MGEVGGRDLGGVDCTCGDAFVASSRMKVFPVFGERLGGHSTFEETGRGKVETFQ